MIPPIATYETRYDVGLKTSERRVRVMCNAWFGLDLFAGLKRTATERSATEASIRFLRKHGLLYGETVTEVGKQFLRQIKVKDGKRGKTF
jgi:hypothetical protein